MNIYDYEKYKDMILKVNFKHWDKGTECFMSAKGNIVIKDTGELVFSRNTMERNPDLMGIFFDKRLITLLTIPEVKLIKDVLKAISYNPSDVIEVKEEKLIGMSITQKFLRIKTSNGLLIAQVSMTRTLDLFNKFPSYKYHFTVKDFENATIGL